jgi:hypothetical protein
MFHRVVSEFESVKENKSVNFQGATLHRCTFHRGTFNFGSNGGSDSRSDSPHFSDVPLSNPDE